MTNKEHLDILKQGIEIWNKWRAENPDIRADLSRADLSGTHLSKADLSRADLGLANLPRANLSLANLSWANLSQTDVRWTDLSRSNLRWADLRRADLRGADLRGADLRGTHVDGADLSWANLRGADLTEANLAEANLSRANLSEANLEGANLEGANLEGTKLVKTNFSRANLSKCHIFDIFARELNLEDTIQTDLIITPYGVPVVTVDTLEVAQFVYLLLNNNKLRDVINTTGNKAVLILGHFPDKYRKEILDALRDKLRVEGYLPITFDFEKAQERNFTKTVRILAGMSLFIIADITNPKSAHLELQANIPDYGVPLVPILHEDENPFAMFVDLQTKYPWVTGIRTYNDKDDLLNHFGDGIVKSALEVHTQLLLEKYEELRSKSVDQS